ncbi:hypothetical protein [Rhizobium sp. RAF56]|uniref:hypothetical protein n=1 Tax=Rhizobium sp. RAF56 TaxID=3233062 RepID=UPI003F98B410
MRLNSPLRLPRLGLFCWWKGGGGGDTFSDTMSIIERRQKSYPRCEYQIDLIQLHGWVAKNGNPFNTETTK